MIRSAIHRPSMPAVICTGIAKEYRAADCVTHALRGVNLEIHAGELTLLVGPSGCGKTTLISIIAGLLAPTSGRAEVFGTDLVTLRDDTRGQFRGRHIGFIFQEYHLLPSLTAQENASLPLLIQGVRRRDAILAAARTLEVLGMRDKLQALPRQLSGGQQQRVAIARAIVHQPRLVVCDEPTAALDAQAGRNVMMVLRDLGARNDRAVVVVTHDNRVFEFADRIIKLEDGEVVGAVQHETQVSAGKDKE